MHGGGKIIIFVPYMFAFGGVERLILSLSRYLNSRKMAHTIVCFRQTINLAGYAEWPVEIQELRPARNFIAEGWALNRYLKAVNLRGIKAPILFDLKSAFYLGLFHYQIFHLHLTDPPSLLPADVSKFSPTVRKNAPMMPRSNTASMLEKIRGDIVHRLNRRGVNRARSLIVMTNAIAAELEALYSKKAKVIRPGAIPASRLLSPKNMGLREFYFLSVSRLEGSKRLEWIFEALADLEASDVPLSTDCNWRLDIVGDGSQASYLRTLADRLGISARVSFHGKVSDDALSDLFTRASLFLMPAVQGYGLPALEALAKGVPVILHRDSGVSEILGQTEWVEIIDHGPGDLAAAIRNMVRKIVSGILEKHPLPAVPTETQWSEEIANACGWL